MKTLLASAAVATMLVFAAAAWAGYFNGPVPANHHIHDCTAAPCVYPHLAVGFFPTTLSESRADYLNDPAECNDATDKSLLPPLDEKPELNQPLRAGVCYTSTTLIHLRSIDIKRPDVALLSRNPPRLGEMLGADDGLLCFFRELIEIHDSLRQPNPSSLSFPDARALRSARASRRFSHRS